MRKFFLIPPFIAIFLLISSCTNKDQMNPNLGVDFESSSDTITVGESVTFNDLSEGNVTNWEWSFDGAEPSKANNPNPTVTYEEVGNFQVSLSISRDGKQASVTKEDFITVENKSDTVAPTPCFELIIEPRPERCTYYDFFVDGGCTIDNQDSPSDIEVRWDFDNDGEYDTSYDTNKVRKFFSYTMDLDSAYITMAAKDRNENVTVITRKLDFTSLPTKPDLISGELIVSLNDDNENPTDTVSTGETFFINVNYTCHGDFLSPSFYTNIYMNGDLIRQDVGGCSGDLFGCNSRSKPYTINQAGKYELYFYLDVENTYEEPDETNNQSKIKTLVVID